MSLQETKGAEDLPRLNDTELLSCLGAADTSFVFPIFNRRTKAAQLPVKPITSDTPIDELPVRLSACEALKELGILRVEDLSATSEWELLQTGAIDLKTVTRLHKIASRLDFRVLSAFGFQQGHAKQRSAQHRNLRQRAHSALGSRRLPCLQDTCRGSQNKVDLASKVSPDRCACPLRKVHMEFANAVRL
jgi:hypothetical protein